MTEDQFAARCDEFDKRLEKMEALLHVAYNGAGVINANASQVVDRVNEIGAAVHGLAESMTQLVSEVSSLKSRADGTHAIVRAIAQRLLSPAELAALGIPAILPELPAAKRA